LIILKNYTFDFRSAGYSKTDRRCMDGDGDQEKR